MEIDEDQRDVFLSIDNFQYGLDFFRIYFLPFQARPGQANHVMVHCLDGIEKTGLFLSAYNLIHKMREEDLVDIPWSVSLARDADIRFITGPKQVEFLFNVAEVAAKKIPEAKPKRGGDNSSSSSSETEDDEIYH